MDAAGMREFLRAEYGIEDDEEFDRAAERAPAIMIWLFTAPLPERGAE